MTRLWSSRRNRDTRRRANPRRFGRSIRRAATGALPQRPPSLSDARTDGWSRALRKRHPTRIVVHRIRRGSFDPNLATLEVLVLPDRRDLFDALDRVSARSERFRAVW